MTKKHLKSDLSKPELQIPPQTALSQQSFNNIISEIEDYAILLLDREGTVLTWNKGVELIQGYSATEIIGKNFRVTCPSEDIDIGVPELLMAEAEKLGKANFEGWRLRADGSRLWASVTMNAIHDDAGYVSGFILLTRDLTEKKADEDRHENYIEELRLRNEELQKSEERYHKMIAEVQDYAIILLDVDGKVLDWNKGAEKLKGYKPEEILGKNFRLFYPTEDKKRGLPDQLLKEAWERGSARHEGYRIKRDGTRFWGSIAITAIHDETGQIIGFSKVTKDLSERKIADERLSMFTRELQQKNNELTKSEERYHQMISEVQEYAILLLDINGVILNWNTGAEFIKGYTAEEIVGKNFRRFYTPEDIEKRMPERLLNEAARNGKASAEGWRVRKDGTRFWGSIVITALHDAQGLLIGYSKVTRDLTERKKSDDELRKTTLDLELKNMELEKVNADLSSFAYVVSHDLKEPARKVQIFAGRLLEEKGVSSRIRQYSEKIVSTAAHMQKLMTDLLMYSQLSHHAPEQAQKVKLEETFAAVKVELELRIAEAEATITAENLPTVVGISYQLHQLFINLVSNALKFSSPERRPVIRITSQFAPPAMLPEVLIIRNKVYHLITVSDNGIGFDPAYAERIFEVFQRLEQAEGHKGTGIGLSIVQKVASNHEGLVVAESEPGKGSSFKVYLPVASGNV